MTLDQIKAIAAARTKGPWFTDGAFIVENSHAIIADCKQQLADVFDNDQVAATAEFIAMAANNIDKLIAVAEAARNPALQSGESEVYKWMDALSDLRKALAALESDK